MWNEVTRAKRPVDPNSINSLSLKRALIQGSQIMNETLLAVPTPVVNVPRALIGGINLCIEILIPHIRNFLMLDRHIRAITRCR